MTERDVPPWDGLVGVLAVAGLLVLAAGLFVGIVAPAASVPGLAGLADEDEAEPPRQIHPEESESGDLQSVERRWADRLADRARTTNLSADDREAVRERSEDRAFVRLLDRYESVSERTDTEDAAEAYGKLRGARSEFYRAYDRYWEAHDRYEERRSEFESNGSSDGAASQTGSVADSGPTALYRSAHDVERRAKRVERTAEDLRERYLALENVTGSNYADSRRAITRGLWDAASARVAVREESLRETDLTIDERGANASLRDPLVVSGQVTRAADESVAGAEDGNGDESGAEGEPTAVANGTVRLITDNETAETETGSDGRFELVYRPVSQRPGDVDASIEYVPANTSRDARAAESFEVTMRRGAPDVSVSAEPNAVRYDRTVSADGAITANGTGLAAVPYFVAVGGTVVADNETTGPDGRYAVEAPLPSTVPAGERAVRVVAEPPGNWTLARADGTAPLEVETRQSTLNLTRIDVDGRTVRIAGTLASRGTPVRNRTVAIDVNGTTLTTALTGSDGDFDAAVTVPAERIDGGPFGGTSAVEVSALFTGSGGNLEPDRARTAATVSTAERVSRRTVGMLALIGGIGGAGLLARRRFPTRSGVSGERASGGDERDPGGDD